MSRQSKTKTERKRRETHRAKQQGENRRHIKIYLAVFSISPVAAAICLWHAVGAIVSPMESPHPGIAVGTVVSCLFALVYGICLVSTATSSSYRRGETNGLDLSYLPFGRRSHKNGAG